MVTLLRSLEAQEATQEEQQELHDVFLELLVDIRYRLSVSYWALSMRRIRSSSDEQEPSKEVTASVNW